MPDWAGTSNTIHQTHEVRTHDVVLGTGAEANGGDRVTVHYTGWLPNGTPFDSSHDRGAPFSATLGRGEVIPGWDQGVRGMKVGGRRGLVIPGALAYGSNGIPGLIPPGSPLVFEIELVDLQPGR
ncbi:MAG: FKBP-type peptidyl-prolyl cis-trans isomerase [Myxococcales bacterium]|nr:FKBP-type peptidyl-prolyl cis-trans isomerase [Myxococcales bacterium]